MRNDSEVKNILKIKFWFDENAPGEEIYLQNV